MTREEREQAIAYLETIFVAESNTDGGWSTHHNNVLRMAIKALKQKPIDKSAMMYDIYMEGVNMSGEYQGCWVRFKDIEKIVDKYIGSEE